jgi:simple sugar transport system permease protein
VGTYAAAIAASLVLIGVLLLLVGADPLTAYGTILRSSLGSLGGFGQTLNKATPLILGALAVTVAMRGGFLNVGVDGQIYLGAIFVTGLAFLVGAALPAPVMLPLALLAGAVGGFLAISIAAVLRAIWGVNEIFVTVMLNFVFYYLADYLATGPWNDPLAGEAITRPIPRSAHLPPLLPQAGAHPGILVALAVAVLVAWLLRRTLLGYSIRAMGDNPIAARVGGIAIGWVTVAALTLSGAIAGLAGAIEVSGYHQRLILGLSPGYGYMAILLAVLGKRSPVGVMVAGFAFAVLLVGSDSLQRSVRLPQSAVLVFQAVILLSVLFAEAVRSGGVRGVPARLLGWRPA